MTTAQDTVTQAAAYLDSVATGAASSSNYLAQIAATAAQTAAALRAIVWSGDTLPVMSVAAPASVQLDKAQPTPVTATASLDADSPDDQAGADWTIVGVASSHFDGGTVPGGKLSVPRGTRQGQASWKMAPHAGAYFKNRAQLVLSNPNLVRLAATSVDVTVSGGTQQGGWATNSGLPWASGVTTPSNDIGMFAEIDAFQSARGSKIDALNVKSNGGKGWTELLNAINQKGPIYAEAARRNLMVTQVVDIPKQEPDVINRIIAGSCDQQIRQIGLALMSYGKASGARYCIRLDHEVPFTIGTDLSKVPLATYLRAWNHVAALLKQTIPGVLIEWNTLRSLGGFSLAQLYPGDDFVDVIGNDPYCNIDMPNDAGMSQYVAKYLMPYVAMARQRGKRVGFSEWAVANTGGPHSPLDSPSYIRGMFGFFKANADIMSHECYFHINDQAKSHTLFGAGAVSPDAAAEYQRLWGG